MDLKGLIEWTKEMQDSAKLKPLVRKDPKTGLPRDGDLIICFNMVRELRKRAEMVIEHSKKAEKFMNDITEYLTLLNQRGVVCPLTENDAPPSGAPSIAAGNTTSQEPTAVENKSTPAKKKGSVK